MYDPAHARSRTVQPIGGIFRLDLTLKTCLVVLHLLTFVKPVLQFCYMFFIEAIFWEMLILYIDFPLGTTACAPSIVEP